MSTTTTNVDYGLLTNNIDDLLYITTEKTYSDLNRFEKVFYIILIFGLTGFEILKPLFTFGKISSEDKYIYDIVDILMKFLFNGCATKRKIKDAEKMISKQEMDDQIQINIMPVYKELTDHDSKFTDHASEITKLKKIIEDQQNMMIKMNQNMIKMELKISTVSNTNTNTISV